MNISPSVIKDAIRNATAVSGHAADVTVIVNEAGKVITVIPKQEDKEVFIKFDDLDMLDFLKMSQHRLEKRVKQNIYIL